MEAVISYIIRFLLGEAYADSFSKWIGYTSNPQEFSKYRIVIIPSPFFNPDVYGTALSMPQLPLNEIEGIPLLFGSPQTEWRENTCITHADIIASSYFLLTRYEEIIKRDKRDKHGRFQGKESLPCKARFIHRPIVDEYGKLLRNWLRKTHITMPQEHTPSISKIWLTHDVDAPFFCRTFRNLLREIASGNGFHAWKIFTGPLQQDPFYTFPWFIKQENELKNTIGKERCQSVFFIKAGGNSVFDKPFYKLHSDDMQELLQLCEKEEVQIGIHASYDVGKNPQLISTEKELLQQKTGQTILYNRHHYLALREPDDMEWLIKAGITDDFTMGYADVAGFRLGTCHPVRWINPKTRQITSLTLHPLPLMECTLSEPAYMHLDYDEALNYSLSLIEQIASVNGELTLLWHNDSIPEETRPAVSVGWQRKLYVALIEKLKRI